MSKDKVQVKAVFHFIDGTTHEVVLSVKPEKEEKVETTCNSIMTSIADQVGKYNVLAFIDQEFASNQFLMVRDNIKMIEFFPLKENDCEEKEQTA